MERGSGCRREPVRGQGSLDRPAGGVGRAVKFRTQKLHLVAGIATVPQAHDLRAEPFNARNLTRAFGVEIVRKSLSVCIQEVLPYHDDISIVQNLGVVFQLRERKI